MPIVVRSGEERGLRNLSGNTGPGKPNFQPKEPMNLENTQVQMRKGVLEFCILSIIARDEVYASDMLTELTSAKIMVVEGTLYPLLTRLRKADLVDYKWVESAFGPPRKYYTLTPKGLQFLTNLRQTWNELVFSTTAIVGAR
jgi:PadR family transcriptional regulator PadR